MSARFFSNFVSDGRKKAAPRAQYDDHTPPFRGLFSPSNKEDTDGI